MRKLLLAGAILFSLASQAQKSDYAIASEAAKVSIIPNKVDLHMEKYEDQMRTGKAFLWTGAAIYTLAAGVIAMNDKNRDLGMATGVIGGAFQVFGFINIADARRHLKKAWAADRTAVR